MLLSSFIVPSFSMYHIIVHAFFKSLLFLLSAEIIHNSQANWQSIYTLKIKTVLQNSFLRAYLLCTGSALMFSASKEGILSQIYYLYSKFIFLIAILGAFFTTFYTMIFLFFARSKISTSISFLSYSFYFFNILATMIHAFLTLAITSLIVDKLLSDILLFIFITYPRSFPYFSYSVRFSFLVFF